MLSFEMMAHIPEEMRETLKAKEAATMEHPLVRIDDNIYSVMEKISNDEFEILPVMDKDGKVLGLISDSDVLQAFSLGEKKMNLFN